MNAINIPFSIATLFVTITLHPKMVEFAENTYAMQAPTEIVEVANKTAERIGFADGYEIVVPKKAGLTGWNRFAAGATNEQTKNAYLIVNPIWFNQIPQEQQMFLLARGMLFHTHGIASPYGKYITIGTVLFSILTIIFLFWLLGKTPLAAQHRILRWFIACALTIALEKIAMDPLVTKVQTYAGLQHDIFITKLAVKKLGDKEAAIKALELYDASIKAAVNNGEALFKPFETRFADVIASLQK